MIRFLFHFLSVIMKNTSFHLLLVIYHITSYRISCLLPVNHTRWATVVTLTDHPKSAQNRCDIERFDGVFV